MAEISYLHLEDDEDDVVVDINPGADEGIASLESTPFWSRNVDEFDIYAPSVSNENRSGIFSDGSDPDGETSFDLLDRENQVNFVMGLFDQRVEDSGFGVIGGNDDMGLDNLELDIGLDFGLGFSINSRNVDVDVDEDVGLDFGVGFSINSRNVDEDDEDYSGFICGDCGDECFESVRGCGSMSDSGDSEGGFFMEGLRDVEIELGEGEGRRNEVVDGDEEGLGICFDSLQLEDGEDVNNDEGNGNGGFEWEEVDGRVDEREVLSMFFEGDEDDENSVLDLRESGVVGGGERNQTRVNLEWEVLLDVNNFGVNHGFEQDEADGGYVDQDEYMTGEYETLFAQFGENDNVVLGRPPASKNVVESLDLVLITEEDVENDNALCAVCKDGMNVGEKAKQLPCSHRYHGDCIVPWLGIRNTCPVCRYELPTDDPDYERRKRSLREVQVQ